MVDQETDRREREAAKLFEWMNDTSAIEEAWNDLVSDDDGLKGIDVAIALTCHVDGRTAHALRILDLLRSKVRDRLVQGVSDAVDADELAREADRLDQLTPEGDDRGY